MQMTRRADTFRLERLLWDSAHFGMSVAWLRGAPFDEPALRLAIESAREAGIHLLYWAAELQDSVPGALLRELGGDEVDRKATFKAALHESRDGEPDGRLVISHYPVGPPSPRLIALAVAAGAYSRFRRDPRIPSERFHALYERWITRSTLGEIADAVLVARARETPDDPIGLVTLSITEAAGSIGLIAVEQKSRGCGVGSFLLRRGHHWLASCGAQSVSVVTQLDNQPACRLYEKAGYQRCDVKLVYHFWPQAVPRASSDAVDESSLLPRSDHHGAT